MASEKSYLPVVQVPVLQIPDIIKELPVFTGNTKHLFDFISNVEEILSCIPDVHGTRQGKLWLRAIRNKIVGSANEMLISYGASLDWKEIKQILILHYSDTRNETSLNRDLHNLKQSSNTTVEQYYRKVIELNTALINFIKMNESNENVIIAKRNLYEGLSLSVFLEGLREPLGSVVRSKAPSNLREAFKLCLIAQNNRYYNRSIQKQNDKTKHNPQTTQVIPSPSNVQQPQSDSSVNNSQLQCRANPIQTTPVDIGSTKINTSTNVFNLFSTNSITGIPALPKNLRF